MVSVNYFYSIIICLHTVIWFQVTTTTTTTTTNNNNNNKRETENLLIAVKNSAIRTNFIK